MKLTVKVHNRREHFPFFEFQCCDNTILHPRLKEIAAEQGGSTTNAPDMYSGDTRVNLGRDRDYPDRGPL
jgi:hypothetical protein